MAEGRHTALIACVGRTPERTGTWASEASQAAGAAPTLRYGPAGDSAPRLRLRWLVWPKGFLSAFAPNMNDNILYHALAD